MTKTGFCSLILVFFGCMHSPQELPENSPDIEGFTAIFEKYEEFCPYFVHKDLDWASIGEEYFTLANNCQTEDAMAEVVAEMVSLLEDPTIRLTFYDPITFEYYVIFPFSQGYFSNYNMDVLVNNYLLPHGWAGWEEGYVEDFGWCPPEILPYIFLNEFPDSGTPSALNSLDSFVTKCNSLELPAVIIDIRMNPEGLLESTGACAHSFMGRFAAKSYPGAIYRSRSGPEYDQYVDARPAVFKAGEEQFTGTVILLIGENCIQDSENMTANFINFPNVVLVGDTTGGSVSFAKAGTAISERWSCGYVNKTILTYNSHWIEGNGIYPDIVVETSPADLAAGIDPVLDYAIEMLDSF